MYDWVWYWLYNIHDTTTRYRKVFQNRNTWQGYHKEKETKMLTLMYLIWWMGGIILSIRVWTLDEHMLLTDLVKIIVICALFGPVFSVVLYLIYLTESNKDPILIKKSERIID
jgi:hypothetical protein